MRHSGRMKSPRDAAMHVARGLLDAGHETYFAGGCVRDRLLGLEPADYDIATSAHPETVAALFPHAKGVGAHFGVMLVPAGGRMIEVATFRSDGTYEDGRRPREVSFGSARADALRRDFTINGLFEHPDSGLVIDFVGGREDLDAGVLRAIGVAEERIEEDRLRMLRAVRFSARFSLEIAPSTGEAITVRADRLDGVSRERVGHELRRMLAHSTRAVAAELAEKLRLDHSMLGSSRSGRGLRRLSGLGDEVDWIDGLAAWEIDRGTAGDQGSIRRLGEGLILSNREVEDLEALLELRRTLLDQWSHLPLAARKRLAGRKQFERALLIAELDQPDRVEGIRLEFQGFRREGLLPDAFIGGDDLIEAGLVAGPEFKAILEATYDAQLEGRVHDRGSALAFALRWEREG